MGWAVAAAFGLGAALVTSVIGGASGSAGFVIGLVSFGVFGVLLGAGGVELTAPAAGAHHAHGGSHDGGNREGGHS